MIAVDADAERGKKDGCSLDYGREATLAMPAVIEVFEKERRALISAFSG